MKLAKYCVFISILLLTINATASPLSYITGTYTYGGVAGQNGNFFPALIPQSSSFNFESPHYHVTRNGDVFSPSGTADSYLLANLEHGSFHASAATAASISGGGAFPITSRGIADLKIQAFDLLHFSSEELPEGTDITFEVTMVLHSILDASWVPGDCPPSYQFATYAYINLDGSFQPNGIGTLGHTSCGDGSEFMTASVIRHARVGGDFQLVTGFGIQADSSLTSRFDMSSHANLDASHTGSVYIKVLTPGAAFKSDSGAAYTPQAVPEPATFTLLIPALGAIALLRKRGRSI
jgi:hypothetical protein